MAERYRVTLVLTDGTEHTVIAQEDEFILDAAVREGIDLPYTCMQGWCTSCAGQVIEGEFDQTAAFRYFDEDAAASYILLCTATPKSDLRIETHQKPAMQDHRQENNLPTPRG